MPKLFGFSIDDSDKKPDSILSPVPKNNEDGADYCVQSGFYGSYVDIEGRFRTEYDLIRRYREMALHPEADAAVEDVVNEAIVSDLYDSPVEIELSNLNASDKLKNAIRSVETIRLNNDGGEGSFFFLKTHFIPKMNDPRARISATQVSCEICWLNTIFFSIIPNIATDHPS